MLLRQEVLLTEFCSAARTAERQEAQPPAFSQRTVHAIHQRHATECGGVSSSATTIMRTTSLLVACALLVNVASAQLFQNFFQQGNDFFSHGGAEAEPRNGDASWFRERVKNGEDGALAGD